MNKIHQLPPLLVNQIAAGEVVERPASVAKELLENALDAGAHHIRIDVAYGGVRLLRVTDDGEGMSKEDLLLATKPHTTSKIRTESDLHHIGSLGFRGEALASISSIARLQIHSHARGSDDAWKIQGDENALDLSIEPSSQPVGTMVEVRDLFYNTPARRKFLRSDKTEFGHIEALVKNVALSHFAVGFELHHNNCLIFQLKPAKTDQEQQRRIAKLLDNSFLKNSVYIDFSAVGLRLQGWLGLPTLERNQTDWQFFYVNGRMVRDRLLNHAIKQAYQDQLYTGKHPSYILYLQTALDALDVNVHPTKHEVRFHDTRLIHDFIFRHLFDVLNAKEAAVAHADVTPSMQSSTIPSAKPFDLSQYVAKEPEARYTAAPAVRPAMQSRAPHAMEKQPSPSVRRTMMRISETIVLEKQATGVRFVNLRKAQYAVAYQQLKRSWAQQPVNSPPLLIPDNVTLSQKQFDYLVEHQTVLATLGLHFNTTSEKAIIVRRLPSPLKKVDAKALFITIAQAALPLEHFAEDDKTQHALLQLLAQSAATTVIAESTSDIDNFLNECDHIDDPYAKKALKAAVQIFTVGQIEKMFAGV